MNDRIAFNQIKGIFLIGLFLVLILQSILGNAQSLKKKPFYKGLQANFATRSFNVVSNIPEINGNVVTQAGGQIGVVFGNEVLRSKIGLIGYYSSVTNMAGTIDLHQTNASLNFYPLALTTKKGARVQPYILGAIAYDRFKFYGYYLNQDEGKINYSNTEAPYLGAIKQVNTTIGTGIELKLIDRFDFVHFFTEVRYGHNISGRSGNAQFDQTAITNQMQCIAGIMFGSKHR